MEFPSNIKFKFPWRKYQQRVLEDLENHLQDQALHVIAPPGSGKTVLGLEVMLRINKPTLILAPTIAIKHQWIDRFCELFLQTEQKPDWISDSIYNPKFITVATYQGLHAACAENSLSAEELKNPHDEIDSSIEALKTEQLHNIIHSFKDINLGTIIADEAHHLKNEWWKTLIKLKDELSPIVVGLTATPPYDVSYLEWMRYTELNGPVDTEISVPELVKEGDLCPHQDYVFISNPAENELEEILNNRNNVLSSFTDLSNDKVIVEQIKNSALMLNPETHLDWIYNNMQYYSAVLIFLNHNNIELDKYHLTITGNKKQQLPKLDFEWFEIFIEYYLNKFESQNSDYQKQIKKQLRQSGIIERGKFNFSNREEIENLLVSSIGKLESIKTITKFENESLGSELREVILSDYIRKDFLSNSIEINKLGVIPIFETLRRDHEINRKMGVLTGSIIILHESAIPRLEELANTIDSDTIKFQSLSYDQNYFLISVNGKLKNSIVKLVTELFNDGIINILIGTKSYLGEGWDAPTINTLILASFVGSYVLSNQMRGRAIRSVRTNNKKTGNIWHLACNDPSVKDGGKDIALLSKRLKSFVGISERENRTIENGFTRLNPPIVYSKLNIDNFNQRMIKSASERDILREQWHEAIKNGTQLIEEIKIPYSEKRTYKEQKDFYFKKTVKNLLIELGLGIVYYTQDFVDQFPRFKHLLKTEEGRMTVLGMFLLGIFVFFGGSLFKSAKLFFKYRDISKDIRLIANALLQSLIMSKQINTKITQLKLNINVNNLGEIFCSLEGGTTFEKSLFIKSLQEIVGPVNNPRYIIMRKNIFLKFLHQKDYHPVPEILSKYKSTALEFKKFWREYVSECDLIFTRTTVGRAVLLIARFNSLASEFQDKSDIINRWK